MLLSETTALPSMPTAFYLAKHPPTLLIASGADLAQSFANHAEPSRNLQRHTASYRVEASRVLRSSQLLPEYPQELNANRSGIHWLQ